MALSVSYYIGSPILVSDIVWEVGASMTYGIEAICGYAGCEVNELNVQRDHFHLVVMVPPKLSILDSIGRVTGQTSMKMFNQYQELKKKS
jgi:putative transposase